MNILTQGERVRKIRKSLNLTLEKFGKTLGVKKGAISKLEKGQVNLTEQMAKLICREYNVNDQWLKTGTGEIFIQPFKIDDEIMIQLYLQLSDKDKLLVKSFAARLANEK